MKYVINIPNYSYFSEPENLIIFAKEVEKSGWDGLFMWDHLQLIPEFFRDIPFIDPYVALTIIACNTKNILLGPYVTPISRRRPWQVYRQLVSLDHLSKGRIIFGVGLGTPAEFDFSAFGDESDNIIRGEMLDESLEIIELLSTGEEISYKGKHYNLNRVQLLPRPYNGRIPIFVAGQWPNKNPFKRAAHYDGALPISKNWPETLHPKDIAQIKKYVMEFIEHKKSFDIVIGGISTVNRSQETLSQIEEYKKSGATWWVEDMDTWDVSFEEMLERVRIGPPTIK